MSIHTIYLTGTPMQAGWSYGIPRYEQGGWGQTNEMISSVRCAFREHHVYGFETASSAHNQQGKSMSKELKRAN